jgi:hypothetical protein
MSPSLCVAVGSYLNGDALQTLIESWNGTAWSVIPSPNQGISQNELYSVSCTSSTACVAVGEYFNLDETAYQTLVESWNGSAWSITSSPNAGTGSNDLGSISSSTATKCAAVGSRSDKNGFMFQTLTETWDGTVWRVVSTPRLEPNTNDFYLISSNA